jgi:hypothetical protein
MRPHHGAATAAPAARPRPTGPPPPPCRPHTRARSTRPCFWSTEPNSLGRVDRGGTVTRAWRDGGAAATSQCAGGPARDGARVVPLQVCPQRRHGCVRRALMLTAPLHSTRHTRTPSLAWPMCAGPTGEGDLAASLTVPVVSGAGTGFGLGGAFGFIMGGVNTNPALMNEDPTKLKFRDVMRATGRQSWSYARNFGMVGALYAGSECVIESVRRRARPHLREAACSAALNLRHGAREGAGPTSTVPSTTWSIVSRRAASQAPCWPCARARRRQRLAVSALPRFPPRSTTFSRAATEHLTRLWDPHTHTHARLLYSRSARHACTAPQLARIH